MNKKYLKAVVVGIVDIFLIFFIFIAMAFLFSIGQGSSDSGPAAVGAAMIFGIVSLASMVLVGIISTWWALGRNSSIKEAIRISSIAGAIPSILLCIIILVFEFVISINGPYMSFSLSSFISTLSSGLTVCCAASFFIGILLSVIGGLAYTGLISLYKKYPMAH